MEILALVAICIYGLFLLFIFFYSIVQLNLADALSACVCSAVGAVPAFSIDNLTLEKIIFGANGVKLVMNRNLEPEEAIK